MMFGITTTVVILAAQEPPPATRTDAHRFASCEVDSNLVSELCQIPHTMPAEATQASSASGSQASKTL